MNYNNNKINNNNNKITSITPTPPPAAATNNIILRPTQPRLALHVNTNEENAPLTAFSHRISLTIDNFNFLTPINYSELVTFRKLFVPSINPKRT